MDPCICPYVNIDFMMYITLDTSHQTKNGSSQDLLRYGALRHNSPTYWEMTVTSQNVATILGLYIHRPPIFGTCDLHWSLLCYKLLGVTLPTYEIRGLRILAQ